MGGENLNVDPEALKRAESGINATIGELHALPEQRAAPVNRDRLHAAVLVSPGRKRRRDRIHRRDLARQHIAEDRAVKRDQARATAAEIAEERRAAQQPVSSCCARVTVRGAHPSSTTRAPTHGRPQSASTNIPAVRTAC